ncbi:MAG: hypothetical protein HY660_04305 [Armatimonadetes bacterium]|nr:hypothetical protein [Armatimonadota bacterium]
MVKRGSPASPDDAGLPSAPAGVDPRDWWHSHWRWWGRLYPFDQRLRTARLVEVIWESPEYRQGRLAFARIARGPAWVRDYLERTAAYTAWELFVINRTDRPWPMAPFDRWDFRVEDDRGRRYAIVAFDDLPRVIRPGQVYNRFIYTEQVDRTRFTALGVRLRPPATAEEYRYRWSADLFADYLRGEPSMRYHVVRWYSPASLRTHIDFETVIFPYWRSRYGCVRDQPCVPPSTR